MRIATLAAFCLSLSGMLTESLRAQTAPASQAEHLIQRIQHLDGLNGTGLSLRACDMERDQQAHGLMLALAGLGPTALPRIQEALKVETWRPSSAWLLYSFARIRGPNAFDELLASASVRPSEEASSYLLAAAVARNLTRVVGRRHDVTLSQRGRIIVCSALEPRHTLDLFLVGLLQHDRSLLARSLGPGAVVQLAAK